MTPDQIRLFLNNYLFTIGIETLVLLVGFGGFTGATFAFSARAIDENDKLIGTEALRWGAVIVVAFGLFALGLSLA